MAYCYLILLLTNFVLASENIYQYTGPNGNLVIGNKINSSVSRERARQNILKEELVHEKTAMLKSQSLLAKAKTQSNIEYTQKLEADINQHQKNITILTKQIANN